MNRILIVKTTSMGDVIHALPVVADMHRVFPSLQIDWMVESPFEPLVAAHAGVNRTIPVAWRAWRQQGASVLYQSWKHLREELADTVYDAVLDLQGLIKSACLARAAHARIYAGPGWRSAREPLAALAYGRHGVYDAAGHVVTAMRDLAASCLRYSIEAEPDFGLTATHNTSRPSQPRHVYFCHGTARAEKSWPVQDWQNLALAMVARGWQVRLPWGHDEERRQAERIAEVSGATVLPKEGLASWIDRLGQADLVVGVDSGLMHLAAALNKPMVALFMATSPARYGPVFNPAARVLGTGLGAVPRWTDVLAVIEQMGLAA